MRKTLLRALGLLLALVAAFPASAARVPPGERRPALPVPAAPAAPRARLVLLVFSADQCFRAAPGQRRGACLGHPVFVAKLASGAALYLYNGPLLIEETDGRGQHRASTVYANGLAARVLGGGAGKEGEGGGEGEHGGLAFYHEDGKGWVAALTGKGGNVIERYAHDAYGQVSFLGPDGQPRGGGRSRVGNPFVWVQTYFHDQETGLYRAWWRSYDPRQGRWLQRDPLGYVDGMGLQEVGGGDPINRLDVWGATYLHEFELPGGGTGITSRPSWWERHTPSYLGELVETSTGKWIRVPIVVSGQCTYVLVPYSLAESTLPESGDEWIEAVQQWQRDQVAAGGIGTRARSTAIAIQQQEGLRERWRVQQAENAAAVSEIKQAALEEVIIGFAMAKGLQLVLKVGGRIVKILGDKLGKKEFRDQLRKQLGGREIPEEELERLWEKYRGLKKARITTDPHDVYKHLGEKHGIPKEVASKRLHDIKKAAGKGPADDVLLDYTGNVYDPVTGDLLGSLTQGGSGGFR